MSLHVQQFLRGGGTLNDLLVRYAIKARRHTDFPSLVCLKYNQIDSPFAEPIVRECRGIILDEADGWRVVARTFDKFFNHGEGHAAPIDWGTARVQEKLDGSLMQLYWYRGEWRVASSGTPDASGRTVSLQAEGADTFADLFWRTHAGIGYSLPRPAQRGETFAFELMTPQNRVVVRHSEPRLVLLAVRDTETGIERRPNNRDGYPIVREFSLGSFDDVLASFQHIDPLCQEGYVVVDGQWNRVKMKHPGYVAIAHMAGGGCSPRRVMEIVRSGESAEVLAHFPEWRPMFDDLGGRFNELVADLEAAYERIAHIPAGKDGQKAFAMEANRTRCPSALFQVRAGKATSVREFLAGVNIDHLLRALEVKDEPLAEAA
jgi:hypothetical protein